MTKLTRGSAVCVKAFFYSCKSFTFSVDLGPFKPPALVVLKYFSRIKVKVNSKLSFLLIEKPNQS